MGMSTYLQKAILNHITGKIPYPMPTTIYLGLLTEHPALDNYASVEVSGASYRRIKVEFNNASYNSIRNATDVIFNEATENWGTIKTAALFDNMSAGNLLFTTTIPQGIEVTKGTQLVFKANEIALLLS